MRFIMIPTHDAGVYASRLATWLFVLFVGESLVISPVMCESPRIGQPTTKTQIYGLLKGPPANRIVGDGELEVTFETAEPTPPAVVYFGINDVREGLDYPRFRKSVKEEGVFTELRSKHRVLINFSSLLASMPNTTFEPRICWRAEVYVPSMLSSRFVEGRCYFNPQTLGDTVNITLGPFVEQITRTSALITFETDRPAIGTVRLKEHAVVAGQRTKHEILLKGLSPETEYEYRVKAGDTLVRPYTFKTSGASTFEFAAMVDSREGVGGGMQNAYGVNAFTLYALGSDAYYRGADFMIFAGDLINGYTTGVDDFRNQLNSFRQIFAPVHARVPIYEGMGNHEACIDVYQNGAILDKKGPNSAEAVFADMFTNPLNGPDNEGPETPTYKENVYTFDYGHARFFILNNNYWWSKDPHRDGGNLEGYVLPQQIEWLRREVAKANADANIKLLFFAAQEPPFPNGGHTKDAMWYKGGDTNRDGKVDGSDIKIVENRNEFWEIMASSPKSVAFISGDEHAYSRIQITRETNVGHTRKPDGTDAVFQHPLWQVTAGGAGAPWYDKELDLPWSPHLAAHSTQPHYAYFRVNGEQVVLEVYAQTGEKIDTAALR
jgi:hypothetical protein